MAVGGSRVEGYAIERELGRGGMGVVYLATHIHLDRRVALKVLEPSFAEDAVFRERFIRESQIAASLTHPNVVPVYDAGERDGLLYIAMQYIEGTDLGARLAAEGPMDPHEALPVIAQIAAALDHAHDAGLVHRDVKPANIILSSPNGPDEGRAFLTDFGLSRHESSRTLTGTGEVMGTFDYLPPERIENRPVDGRADLYSLACVLFEALCGHPPFEAESDAAVLWGHMRTPPPSINELMPALPRRLDGPLHRALAKEPRERFESCGEFVRTIARELSAGAAVCRECGEDNPERAKFCQNCAAPLRPVVESRTEERKVVSVLLVDLSAGSPAADPEDVRNILAPYHARIEHEIERFGGSVERLAGDSLMAVFGAPVAHEDDAERAVRAVLRIVDAVEELERPHPDAEVTVRAAVNTGEAVVAVGGTGAAVATIVTGDVVNLASRIRAAAPAGGAVVGEVTYRSTRDVIEYEALAPLGVEGERGAIPVWEVKSARGRFGVDVAQQSSTPFIGRAFELDFLKAAFRRALQESSVQLVTITGEPGIGKTRILSELASFVDDEEELVFWRQGRALSYGEGITFWALGEIVKAHAGILESDTPQEAVDKLAAAVRAVVDDPSEAGWFLARLGSLVGAKLSDDPAAIDKTESFTAWRRFLEAIALQGPLVLVFEDLHWADGALLEFIDHLVDWATDVPLLVLCTGRPELYENHPGWGGGKRNSTTLSLSPLSDHDTASLVAALLSRTLLPVETQSLLLERAGGNPLYAEEFVRMLGDRGWLVERGGAIEIDPHVDIPLPDTVQALIAARLDTLSPERKALLHDAAVIGKVFWSGAVAAIGDVDEEVVERGLHDLVKQELVRPIRTSSVADQTEYSFWHALIRDVAYGQIPRGPRVEKHRATAEWIEGIAGDRAGDHAEILAHHYSEALVLARVCGATELARQLEAPAKTALSMAGTRAMAFDPARAEAYWRQALELTPSGEPERAEILLRLADVDFARDAPEDAEVRCVEALTEFELIGDLVGKGKAMVKLADLHWWLGNTKRSNVTLRDAIALLEDQGETSALCYAYSTMVADRSLAGAPHEALQWSEKALKLAERIGGQDEALTRTFLHRGGARSDLGDEGGVEDIERALALSKRSNDAASTVICYINLADARRRSQRPAELLSFVEEAIEFAERRGRKREARAAWAYVQPTLFEVGRWDDLLTAAGTTDWGGPHGQIIARQAEVKVLAYRDRLAEAGVLVTEFLPLAREVGDLQVLAPCLSTAALVRDAEGQTPKAVALTEELAAATRSHPLLRAQDLVDSVRILCRGGKIDLARSLFDDEEDNSALRDLNSAMTARAVVAEAVGEFDEAVALYDDAAGRWADFGFVLEHAQALWGAGRCLIALQRMDKASAALQDARRILTTLAARRLIGQVDVSLAEATALSS